MSDSGVLQPIERNDDPWLGGRGPRLTPAQKKRIRGECLIRDGLNCMICGQAVDAEKDLEIDHVDGNAANHLRSNLQLVHHGCNSKKWNDAFWKHQATYQPQERKQMQAAQLADAPTVVVLNREYEPIFRRYFFARILQEHKSNSRIGRKGLREDAREMIGCSIAAAYGYDTRLFAPTVGPLVEFVDVETGKAHVYFRDPNDYNLTVEELERKYPKEGQRLAHHGGA